MRFASLASGSKGNCLVVEAGATRVLLDCGLAPRETERRLQRLGLVPAELSAILITHEHEDHAGHAFAFAALHGVPLCLSYGTRAALEEAGKTNAAAEFRLIDGRSAQALDGLEVRPFTVPHDAREPVQFVFSDGASRLGVLTDIGASTAHVEATLSGCDALVLECNHDLPLLWGGGYPKWLKERIAGPFGHLDNGAAERLLGALDRTRLQHVVCAHLSEQNNRPELARAALARALGCDPDWVGVATQDEGFGWRDLR
ncbi:MAG: MBL fold metallo-hydrolase [Betaproteobacteria bacterium RIFCSPLOWO2_02_FULL_67_19]|nr:MAG: MBL fold metallo-hydrolase [Betaproteobacteria bacterium RIFCSPLOWO2_02_FULL_67_19]